MKIGSIILTGIAAVTILLIAGIIAGSGETTHENKIRVAYFPNIGHAIPIIGMEKGILKIILEPTQKLKPSYLIVDLK